MHSMAALVDTVNMQKPGAPDTHRPYHHGALYDSLVDAGLALARTGGPGAVVLRAVSRQAGVSHNAAYRHFADHEELVAAVAERCMAELAGLMHERLAEVEVDGRVAQARAELAAVGRAYIEFARAEPGWFRTAFTSAVPPPDGNAAEPAAASARVAASAGMAASVAPAASASSASSAASAGVAATPGLTDPYALLSRCLDRLVEVGDLDPQRRPGAEVAAWSMVHGLSQLMVQGPLSRLPPEAAEQAIATALDVVQRGL